MKIVTMVTVVAVLFNAMGPTLTHATMQDQDVEQTTKEPQGKTGTVMSRGQIDSSKITTGWYAYVVYTSEEGAKRPITGRIVNKDATGITVTGRMQTWTIAYHDIDTLIISKHMQDLLRDIYRYRPIGTKDDARVRVYVPTISDRRMVGRLISVTQDTLIIQYEQDFLKVPFSSLSSLEVRLRQRNTGRGLLIGAGLGTAIFVATTITAEETHEDDFVDTKGLTEFLGLMSGLGVCLISTLIGAASKSEKWVRVSPHSLNLSVAPTSTKGLRAALTFNF